MYNFVNPYNFIPLGSGKAEQSRSGEEYTGVIEYSVLTKTPLFIPNTSTDQAFPAENPEHKSYDFYSFEDLNGTNGDRPCPRPVIPGSEMRGMIRSMYEIMTDSCMSALDDDVILSKRTAEVYKAGLIQRTGSGEKVVYQLVEAEDCLWRTKGKNSTIDEENWDAFKYYNRECYIQDAFPEGCRVSFDWIERMGETPNGRRFPIKPLACRVKRMDAKSRVQIKGRTIGYVIKGEKSPEQPPRNNRPSSQKHCCHIFRPRTNQVIRKNLGQELELLDSILKMYKKNKADGNNGYEEYEQELRRFRAGEGEEFFPVYYSKDGNFLWLSPGSITREAYGNKLKDLVGTYRSCNQKENLCPACSLFGTLGKKFAVSSRLRFADLECEEQETYQKYYEPVTTLYPLSSPKLNNMEFYVKRPQGAVFWTYDYYLDAEGRLHENCPEINGRKFYWHQMNMKLPSGVEKTSQNMTVRPLKKGVAFHGKLYFQRISEKELKQLIWLLNAGDGAELSQKQYGYRLGAAKPFGLGSIAVCVDTVKLRKVEAEKGIIDIREENYTEEIPDSVFPKKQVEQFRKCMDFHAVAGETVAYPFVGEISHTEGFEWFVKNHIYVDRDRRTNQQKRLGMAQKRSQMRYQEYMEAMEPGLRTVEGLPPANAGRNQNGGGGNRNYNQNGGGGNRNYNQNGGGGNRNYNPNGGNRNNQRNNSRNGRGGSSGQGRR